MRHHNYKIFIQIHEQITPHTLICSTRGRWKRRSKQ